VRSVGHLTDSTKPAISIPPRVRGRLRRRERRRNKSGAKQFQPTPVTEHQDVSIEIKSSNRTGDAPPKAKSLDSGRWKYNNGEIDSRYRRQNALVGLAIDFSNTGPREPERSNETGPGDLNDSPKVAFTPQSDTIPVLTIRPLQTSTFLPEVKRFHIMSYFNPTSLSPETTISDNPNDSEGVETEEKAKLLGTQHYGIHIADLIDETGAVDERERGIFLRLSRLIHLQSQYRKVLTLQSSTRHYPRSAIVINIGTNSLHSCTFSRTQRTLGSFLIRMGMV